MDRALQWTWLLVGLVTTVGVIIAGSIRRDRPDRLPTEHVVAATITAVLAWETGVNAATSLGQIGLGAAEHSLWIVGQLVVGVAGVVALALVLRRVPVGVPLAVGVCVMRLASAGIGFASSVDSGALESDPNAGTFIFIGVALAESAAHRLGSALGDGMVSVPVRRRAPRQDRVGVRADEEEDRDERREGHGDSHDDERSGVGVRLEHAALHDRHEPDGRARQAHDADADRERHAERCATQNEGQRHDAGEPDQELPDDPQ
jgi:hypothetical protein